MSRPPIEGIIPAPLSVFDAERRFDYDGFARQIEYLADEGVNGVFIGGTTAEGAYLTAEERLKAIDTVARVAGDRLTIYAVVLRPDTGAVITEMEALRGTRVSYAAAVTPFYMGVSQQEVAEHYRLIADACPLPFMLYNIPQNTANWIRIDTVIELSSHPNIVGIKDSAGDFMAFTHGALTVTDGFAWIQGEDRLDAPSFMVGAPGIVTGLGNVDIRPYVRMYAAVQQGDWETVRACQREINAMARLIGVVGGKVIQAIKSAAAERGRGSHYMRSPAMDLTTAHIAALRSTLAELSLV